MIRRIIYQHTRGPWKGMHQFLAVENTDMQAVCYLHTGEIRGVEPGPLPDKLAAVAMFPDGRMARAMRLKTTDKYVLYQEMQS